MRNPRFRRLGLLGAGTTLALVGAVLSPAAAAGPTAAAPDIDFTKTWSGSVDNGGTATATIEVTNSGAAAHNDVTIVDSYDPGLTFVSSSNDGGGTCTNDATTGFQRVVCTGLTVNAGSTVTIEIDFTGDYWGYRTYTKNYRTNERLDIQKAETHVDIWPGGSTTATVDCPSDYDLLDHSFVLQHVDQDTGDFSDVFVEDRTVDHTSATYTLFNDAGGKAQGKLWAVCLKDTTNLGNPVVWEPQESSTESLTPTGPHERPIYAVCDPGYTPVALNVRATGNGSSDPDWATMDDLFHQTGLEADGSRRAKVWVAVHDHADLTLQWRCLSATVGTKRMLFDVKTESIADVPSHDKVAQQQITCDHHYKGIVGGWRGGKFNGSEPRPITRVYWLWHDGPGTKDFTGKLLCLKKRLVRGGQLKTDGTVTDELWNTVIGTTDNHGLYIDDFDQVSTTVTQS